LFTPKYFFYTNSVFLWKVTILSNRLSIMIALNCDCNPNGASYLS